MHSSWRMRIRPGSEASREVLHGFLGPRKLDAPTPAEEAHIRDQFI